MDSNVCSCCGFTGKILRCGKCKSVYYCNDVCQKIDWAFHKIVCKPFEKESKPSDTKSLGYPKSLWPIIFNETPGAFTLKDDSTKSNKTKNIEIIPEKVQPIQLKLDPSISSRWIHWEPSCQSACNECWKNGGYQRRSAYLSEWVSVYIKNEDLIRTEKAEMPYFDWGCNHEADNPQKADIFELHRRKGKCSILLQYCNCRLATFIKTIWYIGDDDTSSIHHGAQEIVGRYINMRKKKKI